MNRCDYLDLAARGLAMPIGVDLILQEQPDPDTVLLEGERLGRVVAEAAARYRTPLAFPLMDLRLEKADLLAFADIAEEAVDSYHFTEPPSAELVQALQRAADRPFSQRIRANHCAVRYIAERTGLLPVGMTIGPFSLMTKLMKDPITAVALAGRGVPAEEDEGVCTAQRCLAMAQATVERSIRGQVAAGAKAVIVCEPAANTVYLSPRQLRAGADVLERFVMAPNRALAALLSEAGVDLIFHDCGELLPVMVRRFAEELRPVILSLGSSRRLWEDAALVPADVVLFGNLPSKLFYSDAEMPVEDVVRLRDDLRERMRATSHPHILGSECDVLYVPRAAESIRRKVETMLAS